MYLDQANLTGSETTVGIFNREILLQGFGYPGDRRFQKPKEKQSPKRLTKAARHNHF